MHLVLHESTSKYLVSPYIKHSEIKLEDYGMFALHTLAKLVGGRIGGPTRYQSTTWAPTCPHPSHLYFLCFHYTVLRINFPCNTHTNPQPCSHPHQHIVDGSRPPTKHKYHAFFFSHSVPSACLPPKTPFNFLNSHSHSIQHTIQYNTTQRNATQRNAM